MKILIVDDDEIQRAFLKKVLEKHYSAEVIEAKNGVEGLRSMKTKIPDLVILDLMMPLMNGHNMLEKMRDDKTTQGIPVMILSINKDKEIIKKVAGFGVVDYLLKPLTMHQINERLTKFINQVSLN
jgi:DNA-binding response OmpR family regulator